MVETLTQGLDGPDPISLSAPPGPVGRILVVGNRLWAEHRVVRALEAAGFETCSAEQLESDATAGAWLELACVVRTDNLPTPDPRVALAVGRLDPRVGVVVVGNVAFHPFEDRASGQIAVPRLTKRALASLPTEIGRFVPRRLSGALIPGVPKVSLRS